MKKLVFLMVFVMVFFGNFTSVLAEENIVVKNEKTGADSNNSATVSESNNTNVNVSNSTTVDTQTSTNSNTGSSSASYNTGGGAVTTGDAVTNLSSTVTANQTSVSASCNPCGSGSVSAINSETGAGSNNSASVDKTNNTNIYVNNTSNISNTVSTSLDSGGNNASYNTGNGTVSTGNITGDISSTVNTNNTIIKVGDSANSSFSVLASNLSTGANSENSSMVNAHNNIVINSVHDATVNTLGFISADTGFNEASYNVGNGLVDTGNIFVRGRFTEDANRTKVDVLCSFCETSIAAFNKQSLFSAENENTGANSINISDPSILNSVWVFERKVADISDLFMFDLSSGRNKANGNIGGGTIRTGDITLDFSKIVNANNDVITIGVSVPPTGGENPPPPGGGGGQQPSSEGGKSGPTGQVLAAAAPIGSAVLGAVLPATGANSYLIVLFTTMFLSGAGLKRKATSLTHKL